MQTNDEFQEFETSQLLLSLMMLLRNHLELRDLIRGLSCALGSTILFSKITIHDSVTKHI